MWDESGDTLVYLSHPDNQNSRYGSPVFRINSGPALFACLGNYIVEVEQQRTTSMSGASRMSHGSMRFQLGVSGLDGSSPGQDDVVVVDRQFDVNPSRRGVAVDGERPVTAYSGSRTSASPRNSSEQHTFAHTVTHPPADAESPRRAETFRGEEAGVFYKLYYPAADSDASRPVTPLKKSKKPQPKHTQADAEESLQRFIDARNVFAFLSGVYLVASRPRHLPFDVFAILSARLGLGEGENDLLRAQSVQTYLDMYVDDLKLDDIRNDDEAIVETLILGEKWRSLRLYHEAFIHAAGRWGRISNHPGLALVSGTTKNRLERATHDLFNIRLVNINERITDFEFPSVWVGEGRYAEYKSWRNGYDRMRTLVEHHVRHVFGSWPPRAGRHGKGGGFSETGGLNRVVLRRLYNDLCCVYDLTVDREWLHGERIHFEGTQGGSDVDQSDEIKNQNERHRIALRKILGEFDKCSVPVQPEMPFDLPRLPYRLPSALKKRKMGIFSKSNKKVREEEINDLLKNSYNGDSYEQYAENALVKSYIAMEREFGISKPIEELIGARRGAWVFMYAVLQTLVLGVVDGGGLRYGDGCEYFLCENVKGVSPWEKGANRRQTRMSGMWTGGGLMSAMNSAINLGVNPDDEIEMTYRASHCWRVAEHWRLVLTDVEDEDTNYGPGSDGSGYQEYDPGVTVPESPQLRAGPPLSEHLAYARQNAEIEQLPELQPGGQSQRAHCGQTPSPTSDQGQPVPGYYRPQYQHQYHDSRTISPTSPAPQLLSPVEERPAQFEFDLGPHAAGFRKTPPSEGHTASPVPPRAWSPAANQGLVRKSSGPVSGGSSPLRYGSPALDGTTSPYTAYSSPSDSPVLAPQQKQRSATMPRSARR